MNKLTRVICLLAFFPMFAAACSPKDLAGLIAPGPTATSSRILFQDDFSQTTGGWTTLREGGRLVGYDRDRFHIVVDQASVDYWSNPGLSFTDVHIEVDATQNSGPEDNDYGVICRYQDENNFYGLLISSDGYYGISKMKAGEHTVIGTEGMKFSDIIKKGRVTNRIQADCVGDRLILSVNGTQLVEVQDADFGQGDVGLVAGTFDTAGADIFFDNFVVMKPEE